VHKQPVEALGVVNTAAAAAAAAAAQSQQQYRAPTSNYQTHQLRAAGSDAIHHIHSILTIMRTMLCRQQMSAQIPNIS
jgi:hypothetical protein